MSYKKQYSPLVQLLAQDGFWLLSKTIVQQLGIINAWVLTDMIDKREYFRSREMLKDDQWFFYKRDDMREQLNISPTYQRSIIKELQQKGLICTKIEGMPRKTYYKINDSAIERLFD